MARVSIGDYDLSYCHNGVGPRDDGLSLVLIHGAGCSGRDWPTAWCGGQSESLGNQLNAYPNYIPDLPGHGESAGSGFDTVDAYAEGISGFIDALELKRALLVGHSMGAAIALTLAVEHHPRIAGIAMIGGSSRLVVSDTILDGLQTNFEPTIDSIVNYSWFKTTDASLKKKNRQRLIDAGPEVVYNDFLACSRFDLSKRLNEVDVPVLVLSSNEDRMVPHHVSRKMADAVKHAKFVGLENCGHYLHLEQTSRVADELSTFLETKLAV